MTAISESSPSDEEKAGGGVKVAEEPGYAIVSRTSSYTCIDIAGY